MISVALSAECNSLTYNSYYYKGRKFDNVNTDGVIVKNPTVKFLVTGPGVSKIISYNVTTGMGGGSLGNSATVLMDAKTPEQKNPSNYALSEFSVTEVTLDNTSSAVAACEKQLKAEKYDDAVKYGDAAFNSKNWEQAKNYYRQALNIMPGNSYPKDQLEKIKTEEANSKAEGNKKTKAAGLITKGDNSMSSGKYKEAQGYYKEALQNDPDNTTAKNKLADAENKLQANDAKDPNAGKGTNDTKKDEGDKKTNEDSKSDSGDSKEKSDEEKRAAAQDAEKSELESLKEKQRIADEKAEKERQEREKNYYDTKSQETSDNEKTAMELLIQALLVHFFIAKQIYQDVGTDQVYSQQQGDSYLFRAKAGYGITSAPIFFNSMIESYDGNNFSYKTSTVGRQVVSLDLNGGLEYWPLYGKRNGMGFFLNLGAGHGFTFQNFIWYGNGGLQAYTGTEKVKLFGEYSFGYRGIVKNSWIDSREFGTGEAKYTYQRIKIGPRFTFDIDWNGKTKSNLDVLPVFELPSYTQTHYFSPVNMQWMNGIALNFGIDNRLSFNLEYFWRYQRGGEVEYGFSPSTSFSGNFVKLSVIRNFDMFGDSPLTLSESRLSSFKEKAAFKGIMFFNAAFNYNSGKDLRVTKPNLGARVAYEHDFNVLQNTNISTGAGFAINNGGSSTTTLGDTMKTSFHSICIPTAIRSYLNDYRLQKYWVKYGITHHFVVAKNVSGNTFSESYMKTYVPCLAVGLGLDYKMSESGAFRTGISFERSLTPYYDAAKQKIKANQISLNLGVIF